MKISVIGDGGWGTANAMLLAGYGHDVTLWGAFPEYVEEMKRTRRNEKFLKGVTLPDNLNLESDRAKAVAGAEVVVLAEDVSNGEIVDSWKVTANGKTIASGSGLGIKRIRVLPQPIVKTDVKPVEFTHLREGGLPDGYAIRQMFYYVEPKTLNRVMNATTTNGETDTAQWMTKPAK